MTETFHLLSDWSMSKSKKRPKWIPDFKNPERELFLWAVLLNRRELAQLFWRAGKDHIGETKSFL